MSETRFDYITYNNEGTVLTEVTSGPYLITESCEVTVLNHEDCPIQVDQIDICPLINITYRRSDKELETVIVDITGGAILADFGLLEVKFDSPNVITETLDSCSRKVVHWDIRLEYTPILNRILPHKDLEYLNDGFMFDMQYHCVIPDAELEIVESFNSMPDKYQVWIDIKDKSSPMPQSRSLLNISTKPVINSDHFKYWTQVMRS